MNAIVQRRYGSADVLAVGVVPAPRVGPEDVLVAVEAAMATQGDRRLRAGDFPSVTWLPGRLALGLTGPRNPVPGTIFAGRVVEVGAAVTRYAVGDDVFGSVMHGAYAERLVVPQGGPMARMPAGTSYKEACALPYGAVTALVYLRDLGQVGSGSRVCVLGASGGVGYLAVQLALHLGATVTAVCGARHLDRVRALGAGSDRLRVVDRGAEDFRAAGPYDVIFDAPNATRFSVCRSALTADGRYLPLGMDLGVLAQLAWTATRGAVAGGQRVLLGVAVPTAARLDEVRALAEQGVFRAVIDRVFPLARAAEAHGYLEAATGHGAVVLAAA